MDDFLMTPELKITRPNLPACSPVLLGLRINPQVDRVLTLPLALPGLDLVLTSLLSPADDPERPVPFHVCLPCFFVRVFHR